MSTLDELMKIHPPGTKFTNSAWESGDYFACWFESDSGLWCGKGSTGSILTFSKDYNSARWSVYQEPPRKVKKWLWAMESVYTSDEHVVIMSQRGNPIFMTEKYAKDTFPDAIKLEHTMIEVEDTP